jgi:hypothetical protein
MKTDEWICHLSPGKSFVDVGALWNTVNEKVSLAAKAGASKISIADIQPTDNEWWQKMDEHLAAHGINEYSKIVADAVAPNAPELIGVHDVVYCSGIIYHLANPILLLEQLRKCTLEHLILGSMVIPETLETPEGIWDATCSAIFVPSLSGELRKIVESHFTRLGLNIAGITKPPPVRWLSSEVTPWWWLMSPPILHHMVEAASFRIIDEYWSWEERTFHIVAVPE